MLLFPLKCVVIECTVVYWQGSFLLRAVSLGFISKWNNGHFGTVGLHGRLMEKSGIYYIICPKNCLCSCGMNFWLLACTGPRQCQKANGGGGQHSPAAQWRSCHPRCCFHHCTEQQGHEWCWCWLESHEHLTQVCLKTFWEQLACTLG